MYQITLTITAPDGSWFAEVAQGNTRRMCKACAAGLARSYELDGFRVEHGRMRRNPA